MVVELEAVVEVVVDDVDVVLDVVDDVDEVLVVVPGVSGSELGLTVHLSCSVSVEDKASRLF